MEVPEDACVSTMLAVSLEPLPSAPLEDAARPLLERLAAGATVVADVDADAAASEAALAS